MLHKLNKKTKLGFVHPEILIVILIIAIVGVVVFVLSKNSQTPFVSQATSTPMAIDKNDTSNWKTYRSDMYGFEFRYPSYIEITSENNRVSFYHWPEDPYNNFDLAFNANIWIEENSQNLSLGQYAKEELCKINKPILSESEGGKEFIASIRKSCVRMFEESKSKVEIAEINGLRGDMLFGEDPVITSLIQKENTVYSFILDEPETGGYPSEHRIKLFDQILSTFEFIEKEFGPSEFCKDINGVWEEFTQECQYITKKACDEKGGRFIPDEYCQEACFDICKFNQ